MSEKSVPMSLRILDKEYRVACSEDEQEALRNSARSLDDRMQEIRNAGKVIGTERIAVMAALNLAYEALEQKSTKDDSSEALCKRLRTMQDKIDLALNEGSQLEV